VRRTFPSADFSDPNFKKLSYVRYADDWVIGIKGLHCEAENICNRIKTFLNSIGLKLSDSKTKITNLNTSKVLFLGTFISRARKYSFSIIKGSNILKRNSRKLRLEAPLLRIKQKLHATNFMKGNKPYPKFIWMSLEHRQIIHLYNAVFRGFLNYYNFTHNYGNLVSYLGFLLKGSCAKLLASKFTLSTTKKVIEKFGPQLSYKHTDKDGKVKYYNFLKPSYKLSLRYLTNPNPIISSLYGSKSLASLDGLSCGICGSEYRVEMHHVRFLKDLNPKLDLIDKLMAARQRKQIPLCRNCHMDKHSKTRSKKNIYQSYPCKSSWKGILIYTLLYIFDIYCQILLWVLEAIRGF